MKKLKQILAVLVIGTLLFTACDNRDEVEEVEEQAPLCGFTFTSAELNNGSGTALVDVLDYDIDFVIAMSGECSTDYEMKYEVIDYTGSVVYRHDGNVKTVDTFFTIADGNFADHIKVTGYDAAFSIKFTVRNTGSQAAPQTKTINFNFAEFSIATLADLVVYTKQTPEFTTNLTGGGPGETYTAKLEVVQNFSGPMGAGGTLMIGGTAATFNTDTSVTVSDGNPLTINLTPTNAPSGSYTEGDAEEIPLKTKYKLIVTKNGVTKEKLFHLECKRPGFGITLGLSNNTVNIDQEFNLTVDVNLLDGYDQDLTYDFEIDGRFKVENVGENFVNAPFSRNGVISDTSNHTPVQQIFKMKTRSTNNNNETIYVTVKNQYNYIVEKDINIGIN